jgi:hypothetical protein
MKRWMEGVNLLALLASLVMIIAMLVPWWSFQLEFSEQTDLYPYLLDGPGSELVGYKRSPQMTLLTGVFIVSIGLCLLGSFREGRAARIMLVSSGVLISLGVWRLLVRIASVADRFSLPLQGHARGNYGGFAEVYVSTWLRPGLYLIILACVLVLAAGVLHKKIWLQFE